MQVKSLFTASLTALALGLIVSSSFVSTNAQTAVGSQVNPTSTRTLSNGQKATIKGILVENQGDQTFTVREESGASTQVVLAPNASIKTKGGFLKSGNTFSPASLTRGLYLEVEGKADDQGRLVAQKVRFSKAELRVAQAERALEEVL